MYSKLLFCSASLPFNGFCTPKKKGHSAGYFLLLFFLSTIFFFHFDAFRLVVLKASFAHNLCRWVDRKGSSTSSEWSVLLVGWNLKVLGRMIYYVI
jgi:hypothetical protein